jgi:hypothetical protein
MAKMQYREELSKEQDWSIKKMTFCKRGKTVGLFWGGDKYYFGPRYGKDSTCIPGQIRQDFDISDECDASSLIQSKANSYSFLCLLATRLLIPANTGVYILVQKQYLSPLLK